MLAMERPGPGSSAFANGIDIRNSAHEQLADTMITENRICPGCKRSAVPEDGGLVVAFGQSFFHVDCFRCAKCDDQVTADTNLLLLSDGSPICANCSYSCSICRQPILDEAIMTGDDSYHAHCFKCKICKNRIDELVFAKTSQGIYCMDCHSERMAKIRKHNEKKAERERAAAAAAGLSRPRTRENGTSHLVHEPGVMKSPNSRGALRPEGSYVRDAFGPNTTIPGVSSSSPGGNSFSPTPQPPHTISVTVAPPSESDNRPTAIFSPPPRESSIATTAPRTPMKQQDNIPYTPLPRLNDNPMHQSHDEGNRSPEISKRFPEPPLAVPTSKLSKRRSISPGLTLNSINIMSAPASASSPTLSPMSARFPHDRSPSPTNGQHPRSPHLPSESSSRPPSHGSMNSNSTNFRSFSPSQRGTPDQDTNPRLSPDIGRSSPNYSRRTFDDRPSSRDGDNASRPASRAHVPRSIESDSEAEADDNRSAESHGDNAGNGISAHNEAFSPISDEGSSNVSQRDDVSDESESSPIETTSHATFIAPALPPIRFSMNTADFSDLFNSVGGMQSLKSLQGISDSRGKSTGDIPLTPPPSATSFFTESSSSTTMDTTVIGSTPSTSQKSLASNSDDLQKKTDDNRFRELSSSESQPHFRANNGSPGSPYVMVTDSNGVKSSKPTVLPRLQEAMSDAKQRGAQTIKLEFSFVVAITEALEGRIAEYEDLKSKFDGIKRASKQYIDGLTVAQTEYDRELKGRRDAEAEVTRLRVLLSGQTARLTALSGDSRRQELRQKMTQDIHENLSGLEHDLSKLKVQRDMALAEVEELSATKASQLPSEPSATVGRSLTVRLDKLKNHYQRELVPLTEQRETLKREIVELKAARDVYLEETTVLNARNEELAQLSAQYARRMDTVPLPRLESLPETPMKTPSRESDERGRGPQQLTPPLQNGNLQYQLSVTSADETPDTRCNKSVRVDAEMPTPSKGGGKFMKWGSRARDATSSADTKKAFQEHNFQQLSVLRFARCDHCGDKMWGSQLRCTACNISVHVRCINHVQVSCSQQSNGREDSANALSPSMFGRDLIEQVQSDSRGTDRLVPVIVEKCIQAVEARALDYEGIYRKTGGSGQSRTITQLFERGDYDSFDLCDTDRFNDICSVTSVLKTYFRTLPVPLLTYDLHDQFMSAVEIREPALKNKTLTELVTKLPSEHYYTLSMLMIHLSSILQRSEKNLMNARNLGVVFGPTLMRSRDPGAEFSDMAGKALSIEWLVENALRVFSS